MRVVVSNICPNFVFFNDAATTEIYTLSLHDALPICPGPDRRPLPGGGKGRRDGRVARGPQFLEQQEVLEHQPDPLPDRKSTRLNSSRQYLVCRLLLEKKKYVTTATDKGLDAC